MRGWIAGLLTLGACGSANADPALDWSGFYAGAMVGYGWSDGSFYAGEPDFNFVSNHVLEDGFAGIFGGYQTHLASGLVLGIEADIARRLASAHDGLTLNVMPTWFDGQLLEADLNWSGSVRARAGYAAGRWLPFVTAGVGWASYDITHQNIDPKVIWEPPQSITYSETSVGWTAGAGADFALTEKVIARFEYRYADYGKADVPLYAWQIDSDYSLKTHDIIAGLAYRF
ncbi:outer membrane protein [Mesorhizobium sp. VNQ89]|uniref:outer membrane protein n=1 Tax=Mesorhizobium quangtriensis TaxID=3157709 RepID=UPI0032B77589